MRVILPALLLFCFLVVSCKEKKVMKKVVKKIEIQDDAVCACSDKIPPASPPDEGYALRRSMKVIGPRGAYQLSLSVAYQGQLGDGLYSPWLYEITLSSPYETEHKFFTVDPSLPNNPHPDIRGNSTTFIIGYSKRMVVYESFRFVLDREFVFVPLYHAMVNEVYYYDENQDEVVIVPMNGMKEYKREVDRAKRYRAVWAAYKKELLTNKDATFQFTD